MTNSNAGETYSDTVREVLENMAFVFAEPLESDELDNDSGPFFEVSMGFTGPKKGTIGMVAPVSLCLEMGSNMLGDDELEDTEPAADALKELLNIVCGQFLTKFYGQEPVFDLSVPVIKEITSDDRKSLAANEGAILLEADESQIIAFHSVQDD